MPDKKKKGNQNDFQRRTSSRTNKGKLPDRFDNYVLNETPWNLPNLDNLNPMSTPYVSHHQSLNFSTDTSLYDEDRTVIHDKMMLDKDKTMTSQNKVAALKPEDMEELLRPILNQMSNMQINLTSQLNSNKAEIQTQLYDVQQQLSMKEARIQELENVKRQEMNPGAKGFTPGQHNDMPQLRHTGTIPKYVFPAPPPVVPAVNRNDPIMNQDHNARYELRRKLHDLPTFTGYPEEWPMFITSFNESTAAFGYTNLENSIRLQKSIQGIARQTIEAMLIYPENIPNVIKELEFRFGRPELLIKTQIAKVQKTPQIREDDLSQLICFSTQVRNLVAFLRSSNAEQYLQNPPLVEELVSKLPLQRRMEWAEHLMKINRFPSVTDFDAWLSHVARLVSLIEQTERSTIPSNRSNANFPANKPIKKYSLHATNIKESMGKVNCKYCSKDHKIRDCPEFAALTVDQRWKWVKQENVCFACLNKGHRINTCNNRKRCTINNCNMKHNQLLHDKKEQEPPAQVLSLHQAGEQVCFRIVPVTLYGQDDKMVKTFAMLDEGSSTTMMELSLVDELQLKGVPDQITMQWFDDRVTTKSTMVVNCKIQGQGEGCQIMPLRNVQAMKNLNLPCQTVNRNELIEMYPQLNAVPINEYVNARPRILIGLDNARLGYAYEWIDCPPSGPMAVRTPIGWLLYGPRSATITQSNSHVLLIHSATQDELNRKYRELDKMVHDLYDTEKFAVKKPEKELESNEVKRAKQILNETTVFVDGHYESGLLWKSNDVVMPDSYLMAVRRLQNVEKKMKRDEIYAELYKKAVNDFLEKKYARRLSVQETQMTTKRTFYLPHMGVINPNKPGKLRLVFDAAAQINGISLNSQLMKGPDLNQTLMAILSHFRERRIAVCADIKEMFLQVKIQKNDRDSQRFLWRFNGDDPINVYEMESMIFGATCAPTIAQFVKNVNAEKFRLQYPEAADAIIKNHYVDDFVMSFDEEESAIRISREVRMIQANGGFELRGFRSNSVKLQRVLNEGSTESKSMVDMNVEPGQTNEKVLGMYWNYETDVFTFEFKMHKVSKEIMNQERAPTKREMLSVVMSIFDPIGFIADFYVIAKILLQTTWNQELDWDDPLPDCLVKHWNQWLQELRNIERLKVPRCYSVSLLQTEEIQVHIFVDASEEAFAAVSYIRLLSSQFEVSFVYGKTRVAPRKQLSMPRLELQAAVLGIRMYNAIMTNHVVKPAVRYFWSDSKTVLHWIKSSSRKYKPFVAHRISEILESSQETDWKWVPTKLNPADEATRVKFPIKYDNESRWLRGPSFLYYDEVQWPSQPSDLLEHEVYHEMKSEGDRVLINIKDDKYLLPQVNRFSKYLKLKRSTAWFKRAIVNFKAKLRNQPIVKGEITAIELEEAELELCRRAQYEVFYPEYIALSSGKNVKASSDLFKLSPYLHEDGLIRIAGRIDAASNIPFCSKRPIILPKNNSLTELLLEHYHRKLLHQNDETVICQVRQKFWIPHIRTKLKKIKAQCQFCKIKFTKPIRPKMGPLPFDRVAAFVRPFTYTGLDYFGPITVAIGRRREKRWVALFTCLTYRAVHLELATNLSTDACILCIRNFVNLRGVPLRIRSDNGTNFVGIKKELQNVTDFFDSNEIQRQLTDFGIEWFFNSPSDPSAGGSWERLVQSVKRSLKVVLEDMTPKEDTLRSLLLEAANLVNSRPLTHIPISVEDEEPLTPNHFLLGTSNSTQTPTLVDQGLLCSRKQWRISQQLKNHFYQRWITEYLPMLTRRCKYFEDAPPLRPGDLVLVCDTDLAPSRWPKGKIVQVFKGADGQTRTAIVKTISGELRRPAHKLAVLDVEVNPRGEFTEGGMSANHL